jgi:hypothetical protein
MWMPPIKGPAVPVLAVIGRTPTSAATGSAGMTNTSASTVAAMAKLKVEADRGDLNCEYGIPVNPGDVPLLGATGCKIYRTEQTC